MTTINNSENLIEKVGGIEKAREIVEGAPDWPVIGYCIVGNNYIFKQCEHAPCSYSNLDNAWSEEYAIHFVSLNNLRTAIAEHDREFKVGDLVVILTMHLDNKFIHEVSKVLEDLVEVCGSYVYSSELRHATPSEIKAGHRLDQAPKTCGWDLASGNDCSAEPVLDRGTHD